MSKPKYYGWYDDPAEVQAILDGNPEFDFRRVAGEVMREELPENVFLWDAVRKLTGSLDMIEEDDQDGVGMCVGCGNTTAGIVTAAVEIAVGGENETLENLSSEVTYALSRVEIGGGRLRGDGSIGAWAAKAISQFGFVKRDVYGSIDVSKMNPQLARKLGNEGIPPDLETLAKTHPMEGVVQVKRASEAKALLARGSAIAICSNQGFRMKRDANGICDPSGEWAHCMALLGYAMISGRLYFFIDNSWGRKAHTGPLGPGNPPESGFYASEDVTNHILSSGDCWALSRFKGFESRKLRWIL